MIHFLPWQFDVQQKDGMQAVWFCDTPIRTSLVILFLVIHLLRQNIGTPIHLANHIIDPRLRNSMPIDKQILMRLCGMTCKAEKAAKIDTSRRRTERF